MVAVPELLYVFIMCGGRVGGWDIDVREGRYREGSARKLD